MKPLHKNIFIIAVVLSLGVGVLLLWPKTGSDHRSHEREVYYCPMHPNYTSDRPGDCPICNMKLVKKEGHPNAEHALAQHKSGSGQALAKEGSAVEGYATVRVDSARQQLIGIKTMTVGKRPLTKVIRAVGAVAHDEELYQTQAEYLQINAAMEKAKAGGILEIIEGAKATADAVRLRLIHMGFHDGLIEELKQRNSPDDSLLFTEKGPVWIYARIYEYELPYVDVGTPARVQAPSYMQEDFEGLVRGVDPMVDAMTRTVRIRIQVKDAKGVLKPDMYVDALMDVDLGQVLAVPREAVFHTGVKDIVFVAREQGVFSPVEVKTGAQAEGFYEVKEGLKEGDQVVVDGNFLMDSESRLKAVMEGASKAGGGHVHGQ